MGTSPDKYTDSIFRVKMIFGMEAVSSFETLLLNFQATGCHNSAGCSLNLSTVEMMNLAYFGGLEPVNSINGSSGQFEQETFIFQTMLSELQQFV